MSKPTFLEFLKEYDRSDLDLIKQVDQEKAAARQRTQARQDFRGEMEKTGPQKGNLIKGKNGYFLVKDTSVQGTHVRQLGVQNPKEYTLPRDQYRFQQVQDQQYPNKKVFAGKKIA